MTYQQLYHQCVDVRQRLLNLLDTKQFIQSDKLKIIMEICRLDIMCNEIQMLPPRLIQTKAEFTTIEIDSKL